MELTPRSYQLSIYNSIMKNGNTLVVLPTGLGKTLIALMLINERMKLGKCLFLTPTKPLAKQHYNSVIGILKTDEKDVALVSGEISPKKRKEEYTKTIIISTPQTIQNDIENKNFDPLEPALIVFDECHRAVGDYAYTSVALNSKNALIVGLTASPGGDRERIQEVLNHLRIENIEIRTASDADVKPYVQEVKINWIEIALTENLKAIKELLDKMIGHHAQLLGGMGFPPPLKHKGKFIQLRERILSIDNGIKYVAIVQYSILLNLLHMSELIETQGFFTLKQYMAKVDEKDTKSAGIIRRKEEYLKIKELCEADVEHPKLAALIDLIKTKLEGEKIIVFAHYRDQVKKIVDELQSNKITAEIFIGKKDGVTRKMQEKTISDFREGLFQCLVASSIGEEGLDIPAVDAVIFYEPVPSEIRSIQRRGRAGRLQKGEIYILFTKGTRDEYFHFSSLRREKKMKEIIASIQKKFLGNENGVKINEKIGQTKMNQF